MKKTRILMVDDDEELCEEIKEILEVEGYLVDVAHCGDDSFPFIEKGNYNMVLLDLKMPGMNGLELLKQIKGKWPNLKVLVMSGSPISRDFLRKGKVSDDDNDYINPTLKLADGFLSKPCEIVSVLKKIKELSS